MLYIAIIAVVINTYQAAVTADNKGLSDDSMGWFGGGWLYVLALLVVAIATLQIVLYKRRPYKS